MTSTPQRPEDFPGAITKISPDLRSLYLAAYQSHLWNEILAEYLRRALKPEQLMDVTLQSNKTVFQQNLESTQIEELQKVQLPLPSARLHLEEGEMKGLVEATLSKFGTELREIRVKTPRDSFFSKGERAAIVHPTALAQKTLDDDMYDGKKKLMLRFEMPRGSYATMLIKRLQAMAKQNSA